MSSPLSGPPGNDLADVSLHSTEPGSNPCVAFCFHRASHQSDVPAPPGLPPRPHNDRHAVVKEAPGAAAAGRGPGRASCQRMESVQKRAAWRLAPGPAGHLLEDNWVFDTEWREQLENPLWLGAPSQSTSEPPDWWRQRRREEHTKRRDTSGFQSRRLSDRPCRSVKRAESSGAEMMNAWVEHAVGSYSPPPWRRCIGDKIDF